MALFDGSHHVTIEPVWWDESLIEIEERVVTEGWSGVARAYTTFDRIGEFAEELTTFNSSLSGQASLDLGEVCLRLYTIDSTGHIGCHARLSTAPGPGSRPEEVKQLAIELQTEASFLGGFMQGLNRMIRDEAGEAILITE